MLAPLNTLRGLQTQATSTTDSLSTVRDYHELKRSDTTETMFMQDTLQREIMIQLWVLL